jgi:hypothetical protein
LYQSLHSAVLPVDHGPELPVPQPTEILEDASTNSSDSGGDDEEFQCHALRQSPQLFTQSELNDVIRDLGLPKEKAELLGSRLKEKNLLAAGTFIYWYRSRKQEFTSYFSQDGDIVHCCNIPGLMQKFGIEYKANEWQLFIDSSKRSLKAVLHNGNNYASLPIGHSLCLKERNENPELVLIKIGYTARDWMICGDLKVLYILLGQQAGYTKYPCFMSEWDSRARSQHWEQKQWTPRTSLEPGSKYILRKSLVNPKKILLPLLHIILGIMKQFVRALQKVSSFIGGQTKRRHFCGPSYKKTNI